MTDLRNRLKTITFLTDGGLETDMIFNKNIELPHFATFPLLDHPEHSNTLDKYYREYLDIAKENNLGFILDTPTWRANPEWAFKLGYSKKELKRINKDAIKKLQKIRDDYSQIIDNIFISGQIGPKGDGYVVGKNMSAEESRRYHNIQVSAFKEAGADFVTAQTTTCSNEGLGIVKAAMDNNLDVVISFTVETDGKLPNGETLKEAILNIEIQTNSYPLHYMINCAHPSHFFNQIQTEEKWVHRLKGIRANASCKSHAELDDSTELDVGNKKELGQWHKKLKDYLPELSVIGGCCGTDASHIKEICKHI